MKKLSELFGGFNRTPEAKENHSCSCGGEHQHSHDDHIASQSKVAYLCPMKCEGDKTYNAPGNCPVCNMHLTLLR